MSEFEHKWILLTKQNSNKLLPLQYNNSVYYILSAQEIFSNVKVYAKIFLSVLKSLCRKIDIERGDFEYETHYYLYDIR